MASPLQLRDSKKTQNAAPLPEAPAAVAGPAAAGSSVPAAARNTQACASGPVSSLYLRLRDRALDAMTSRPLVARQRARLGVHHLFAELRLHAPSWSLPWRRHH